MSTIERFRASDGRAGLVPIAALRGVRSVRSTDFVPLQHEECPIKHPSGPNDFAECLAAARSGSTEAQEVIFSRFYPNVREKVHAALRQDLMRTRPWLASRFSTGDVVQEVFRSLLGDLDFTGETEDAFIGYLAMVVRNRIVDAIRFHEAGIRDGRRDGVPLVEVENNEHGVDPSHQAAAKEEAAALHTALAQLPERDQLLLRARFEQTATFEQIAAILGFPSESAARRAYHSLRAKLALEIQDPSSSSEETR